MLSVKKSSLGVFVPSEAAIPWRRVLDSGLFSLFRDIEARGVAWDNATLWHAIAWNNGVIGVVASYIATDKCASRLERWTARLELNA